MNQMEKRQLRRIRRYLESLAPVIEEMASLACPGSEEANVVQWSDLARHASFAKEHLNWIRSTIQNAMEQLPPME